MITEFTSTDQDFSTRTSNTFTNLAFLLPICGLAIVALGYAIVYHRGSGKITKIGRISEGLSYMDTTSILISIIVFLMVFVGLLIFLKSYYKRREIVVGLKFNDHLKELTVKTKTIGGQEYKKIYKYNDLRLEKNHLSDGMTPPMYNTLTILKGEYSIGHVFMDHFTWESKTSSDIKAKLEVLLSKLK